MKTPSFWYDTSATARAKAASLSSLSALYALGHTLHQNSVKPQSASIPVICIGNLVAGGGGKTPTALALMQLILTTGRFKNPCFLSRGYGGKLPGPLRVDPAQHDAAAVGDEPLLLAAAAPTIISANRLKGALFAQSQGHDGIIMDDGLQNPALKKDLSFVVIDGATGFGNRQLLPAGPLRTPLHRGLAMADAILMIGDDETNALKYVPTGKLVLHARLAVKGPPVMRQSYYAFCGIAHPDKFRRSLQGINATLAGFQAFPDHYSYTPNDLKTLQQKAQSLSARLITTAKDAARILPAFLARDSFDILNVALQWQPESLRPLTQILNTLVSYESQT